MSLNNLVDTDTDESEEDDFLSDYDDFLGDEEEEEEDSKTEVEFTESGSSSDDDGFLSEFDEPETEPTTQVDYKPELYFHSSEEMPEVEDESVHLVVTSPPYNADWAYGSVDDDLDYAEEYLPMLARIFNECHRVLVPGGRMVINVPSLLRGGSSGGVPIGSDILTMLPTKKDGLALDYEDNHESIKELRVQTDWLFREIITWNKGFNTDGLAPNGSFPRPWGILLNNMHEVALIIQKPGDRSYDDMPEETIEASKIQKDGDDMCDDVWNIHPESFSFKYVEDEDVPVFPLKFAKRAIRLWTYKGDKVLEPFTGRGTTLRAAKELERESVGYELREALKKDIHEYVGMEQVSLGQW